MNIPSVQSLFDYFEKIVLVTGAGSGLGQGIAIRFAQAGARIIVHYRTSAQSAATVVAQIIDAGGDAVALQADVTDESDVQRLIEQSVARFGRIDVLINNAGTYPLHSLLEMSTAQWDKVINANLRSAFLCTQAVARQMIAQGGGSIINITSIEAENPAPLHSHYNAAKAGVAMLTKSSALELGKQNIRVNAVAPGLIWRDGIEQSWPDGVQRWRSTAPLGRLGMPEDVADACLFLASPAARWITGATLLVDGGVMTTQIF